MSSRLIFGYTKKYLVVTHPPRLHYPNSAGKVSSWLLCIRRPKTKYVDEIRSYYIMIGIWTCLKYTFDVIKKYYAYFVFCNVGGKLWNWIQIWHFWNVNWECDKEACLVIKCVCLLRSNIDLIPRVFEFHYLLNFWHLIEVLFWKLYVQFSCISS